MNPFIWHLKMQLCVILRVQILLFVFYALFYMNIGVFSDLSSSMY